MARSFGISFILFFTLIMISTVYSDEFLEDNIESNDNVSNNPGERILDEFKEATLEKLAGTTPDDPLYFIDKFLDRFSDKLDVKEERIAEIKAMIEANKIEEARKALSDYRTLADEIENDINPEKRDRALRSAAAIRNALQGIQDRIPESERDNFVHKVIDKEKSIATAMEIASKIKNLCQDLAKLDPELFYQNCKGEESGPRWQKELFDDLSNGQREEARKFARIMGECFKTSGQTCRCDEIPYESFAKTCSKAAPLATKCEIQGDEEACNELDEIKMPELPPHLQDIFDEFEHDIKTEQFEIHMPRPCADAGIKMTDRDARQKCSRIMIETEAPPECKDALLSANVQNERDARRICDKIMMNKHAPECVEQQISDPEECKDFMWNQDRRPPECEEQGIHDFNDCREFMERGGFSGEGPKYGGSGPRIDFNCKEIQDSTERLECYDRASSQIQGYHDVRRDDYQGPCLGQIEFQNRVTNCVSTCPDCYWKPIQGDSGKGFPCPVDLECGKSGDFDQRGEGCRDVSCNIGSHCEYGQCVPDHEIPFGDIRPGTNFPTGPGPGDFRNIGCDNIICNEREYCIQGRCIPIEQIDQNIQSSGQFDLNSSYPTSQEEILREQQSIEPTQSNPVESSQITGNAFLRYLYR